MPILWLIGGGIAAWGGGKLLSGAGTAIQDTGNAANSTANATLKLAVAGAIGFYFAKKYKVI